MIKVYCAILKNSEGEPASIHPVLSNKVDESKNGEVGYFEQTQAAIAEFGKRIPQAFILTPDEAKGYDGDDLVATAGGNFKIAAYLVA